MSISIWNYEKPLDAMMLNHDRMAALVLKHEQQIKGLAAQLLELKHSTAMFKPGMSVTQGDAMIELEQREWVGLTHDEIAQGNKESWVTEQAWQSAVSWAEAKLKEKNGG